MKREPFTIEDIGTIRLALRGWISRCEQEARMQREAGKELPHMAEKAEANAKASEKFAAEAQALLDNKAKWRG